MTTTGRTLAAALREAIGVARSAPIDVVKYRQPLYWVVRRHNRVVALALTVEVANIAPNVTEIVPLDDARRRLSDR